MFLVEIVYKEKADLTILIGKELGTQLDFENLAVLAVNLGAKRSLLLVENVIADRIIK